MNKRPCFFSDNQSGMTILEIMFSVALLLIMTVSATTIIRNGIDMRFSLAQQAKVNHRLMVAMQKITEDLQAAFIIDTQRTELNFIERSTKSIFALKQTMDSSEFRATTFSHSPTRANAKESDQSLVVYRVEKDTNSGRTHLMRGDSDVLPTQLEDDPPLTILARNIKAIRLLAWNGEDWQQDWNSTRSDWRNSLPRMVRVEIEAYVNDPEDDSIPIPETDPTTVLRTVVYLPRALQTKELRDGPKSPKYEGI